MRGLSALAPALIASTMIAGAIVTAPSLAFAQDAAPVYHPPPAGTQNGEATTNADGSTTTPAPDPNAPAKAKTTEPPPDPDEPVTDVTEKPGKTYYFVGLRYRGDIVPKFMLNLFVDEGKTFYSNTIGAEVDIRRDNFSFIPAFSYVEYGSGGDVLFLEKGKDSNLAGNWSNVNSSLKALYVTADLLWSAKIHKNVDFEFGAGFGLGVLFGDLETSWVYADPNGSLTASSGQRFSPCVSQNGQAPTNPGCNARDHQNSSTSKIDHYTEPSWANGGSKPNLFVHLAIPQLGVRIKPTKDMEYRVGLGFSITGFWFGLSGNYGLERALANKHEPTTHDNPK